MKTITLREISPTKGLKIPLKDSEDWIKDVLKTVLGGAKWTEGSVRGELNLVKTNDIINIDADLAFQHHPLCARCGTELNRVEKIHFFSVQAPLDEGKGKDKEDQLDAELTDDDLNFGYYENDEINIEQILNDEIALSLPYNYYCTDNVQCATHAPKDPHITLNDTSDPRWAALKDLKNTSN